MDNYSFTERQAEVADSIIAKIRCHLDADGNYGYVINDFGVIKSIAMQKGDNKAKMIITPFDQEMIGLGLYINDVTEYTEVINCAALDNVFFEWIMAGCLYTMIRMGIRYEEACVF